MDEGQLPTGGWFWAAVAGAGLIGAALRVPVEWLACLIRRYFGWAKKEQDRSIGDAVDAALEQAMSPIRQHIAEIHKGVEGKQAVIDGRLAEFYREMRDRDDNLSASLHARISKSMADHEGRMTRHIDRQIDQLRRHFTDLLTTALNARR